MATIYQLNGKSVYDLNGVTIDAHTGQPVSGAGGGAPITPKNAITPQNLPASIVPQPVNSSTSAAPVPNMVAPNSLKTFSAPDGSAMMTDGNGNYYYANSGQLVGGPMAASAAQGYAATKSTSQNGTTGQTGGNSGGTGMLPVGNPGLSSAQDAISGLIASLQKGGQIPSQLEITPALIGKFLSWAHTVVDPQTQASLLAEASNINAALGNAQTRYQNTQAETLQGFGMNLLNEQDAAGRNGMTSSGLRNLEERNLVNSTNRQLSTNAANTALEIGNTARTGAEAVGSQNANMFNLPTLPGAPTVSNLGGSTGSVNAGTPTLNFGYDPSIYKTGTITDTGARNVANQQANYLTQYGTLAANNAGNGRSIKDLVGSMTGLPAGASLT